MSHTNSTSNYGLPQWIGTDKPTFLGDFNTAFYDIDAQMKTNADAAASATTTANTAASAATTASTNATTALNTANSAASEAASATSAAASATATANTAATNAATALTASQANNIANLAPAYDPTLTYAVGDLVTYIDENNTGKLYKCIVAVASPETFNINKWDDVTTSEVYQLKTKLVFSYTPESAESFDSIFDRIAAYISTYPSTKKYLLVMDDPTYTTRKFFNHELTDNTGVAFSYVEVGSGSVTIDSLKIGSSNYYRRSSSSGSWTITSKIDETTTNTFSLFEI